MTHDARAERLATRVLTIHDGRLSEETFGGRTALVVDGRGWVRLPDALRAGAGIVGRAVAASGDGQINLVGSEPVSASPTTVSSVERQPGATVVELHDVEIDLGTTTIGPVSMELRRGQITIITGRSGSGKTSVLSLILGVSQPTRGVVDRAAISFGCAPQTAAFAEQLSVADNIDLVRAIRLNRPDDDGLVLLAAMGLTGLADRPAAALSGGERQRLSVARALAVNADVVVLDEPTSQLDRANARSLSRAIKDSAQGGACVVCASHDEELIGVADQIIDLGAAHAPSGVTCQ